MRSPQRLSLCEKWWKYPFRYDGFSLEKVDIYPRPHVCAPGMPDANYPNDPYDGLKFVHDAVLADGGTVHGTLQVKGTDPFRWDPDNLNLQRADLKELLSWQGSTTNIVCRGSPFTGALHGQRHGTDGYYYLYEWLSPALIAATATMAKNPVINNGSGKWGSLGFSNYSPNDGKINQDHPQCCFSFDVPTTLTTSGERLGYPDSTQTPPVRFTLPEIVSGRYSGILSEPRKDPGNDLNDPATGWNGARTYPYGGVYIEHCTIGEMVMAEPWSSSLYNVYYATPWDNPIRTDRFFGFWIGSLCRINEAEDYIEVSKDYPYSLDLEGIDLTALDFKDRRYFTLRIGEPLCDYRRQYVYPVSPGADPSRIPARESCLQYDRVEDMGNVLRFYHPLIIGNTAGNKYLGPPAYTYRSVWDVLKDVINQFTLVAGGMQLGPHCVAESNVDSVVLGSLVDDSVRGVFVPAPTANERPADAYAMTQDWRSSSYTSFTTVNAPAVLVFNDSEVPVGTIFGVFPPLAEYLPTEAADLASRITLTGIKPLSTAVVDSGILDPIDPVDAFISDQDFPDGVTAEERYPNAVTSLDIDLLTSVAIAKTDPRMSPTPPTIGIATDDGKNHLLNAIGCVVRGRLDERDTYLTYQPRTPDGSLAESVGYGALNLDSGTPVPTPGSTVSTEDAKELEVYQVYGNTYGSSDSFWMYDVQIRFDYPYWQGNKAPLGVNQTYVRICPSCFVYDKYWDGKSYVWGNNGEAPIYNTTFFRFTAANVPDMVPTLVGSALWSCGDAPCGKDKWYDPASDDFDYFPTVSGMAVPTTVHNFCMENADSTQARGTLVCFEDGHVGLTASGITGFTTLDTQTYAIQNAEYDFGSGTYIFTTNGEPESDLTRTWFFIYNQGNGFPTVNPSRSIWLRDFTMGWNDTYILQDRWWTHGTVIPSAFQGEEAPNVQAVLDVNGLANPVWLTSRWFPYGGYSYLLPLENFGIPSIKGSIPTENHVAGNILHESDLGTVIAATGDATQALDWVDVSKGYKFFGLRSPFTDPWIYGEIEGEFVDLVDDADPSKILTPTSDVEVLFNVDQTIGTITKVGDEYFYTALKQGVDWIVGMDATNRIPFSFPVVVLGKAVSTTVGVYQPLFASKTMTLPLLQRNYYIEKESIKNVSFRTRLQFEFYKQSYIYNYLRCDNTKKWTSQWHSADADHTNVWESLWDEIGSMWNTGICAFPWSINQGGGDAELQVAKFVPVKAFRWSSRIYTDVTDYATKGIIKVLCADVDVGGDLVAYLGYVMTLVEENPTATGPDIPITVPVVIPGTAVDFVDGEADINAQAPVGIPEAAKRIIVYDRSLGTYYQTLLDSPLPANSTYHPAVIAIRYDKATLRNSGDILSVEAQVEGYPTTVTLTIGLGSVGNVVATQVMTLDRENIYKASTSLPAINAAAYYATKVFIIVTATKGGHPTYTTYEVLDEGFEPTFQKYEPWPLSKEGAVGGYGVEIWGEEVIFPPEPAMSIRVTVEFFDGSHNPVAIVNDGAWVFALGNPVNPYISYPPYGWCWVQGYYIFNWGTMTYDATADLLFAAGGGVLNNPLTCGMLPGDVGYYFDIVVGPGEERFTSWFGRAGNYHAGSDISFASYVRLTVEKL